MTKEVAKKAIDLIFNLYEENNPDKVINKNVKGIKFNFIGGEPLMNIPIMDFTLDYFIKECLRRNSEWLTNFRVSITTNGILYFKEDFQNFFNKYKNFISLTISIDGPKELHDNCRVDYEGNGSFDRAYAAFLDYKKKYPDLAVDTKVTIAPENLKYLSQIFDFFVENGIKEISCNPIFEYKWTEEDGRLYYEELIKIATKLLLNPECLCSRFVETSYSPLPLSENSNWCGGTGLMLSIDPDGNLYPCLRYAKTSLGNNIKPLIIGHLDIGLYTKEEEKQIKKELDSVNRKSQSSEECFYCPIARGCAWCSAWNYQENGTVNKRSTNICIMHKAESLANVFYWNLKYKLDGKIKKFPMFLPIKEALKIISENEYNSLLELSTTW